MSGINSLVGAADSTFSLPGSTGTWLDSFYRDGHSTCMGWKYFRKN